MRHETADLIHELWTLRSTLLEFRHHREMHDYPITQSKLYIRTRKALNAARRELRRHARAVTER